MQDPGSMTTATSQSEGRMKPGGGCPYRKGRKCLKCAIGSGKGGPGYSIRMPKIQSLSSSIKATGKQVKFGKVIKGGTSMKLKGALKMLGVNKKL